MGLSARPVLFHASRHAIFLRPRQRLFICTSYTVHGRSSTLTSPRPLISLLLLSPLLPLSCNGSRRPQTHISRPRVFNRRVSHQRRPLPHRPHPLPLQPLHPGPQGRSCYSRRTPRLRWQVARVRAPRRGRQPMLVPRAQRHGEPWCVVPRASPIALARLTFFKLSVAPARHPAAFGAEHSLPRARATGARDVQLRADVLLLRAELCREHAQPELLEGLVRSRRSRRA